MSDIARIFEVIRDAASRGDDLATALRASGLPGAERAADRLLAGATLPAALIGLVPPRLAECLAGGLPPLATVATLLADEAWRQAERRRLLADHLAYPLASCALVLILGWITRTQLPPSPWYTSLVSLLWAGPPALLALIIALAPWLPRAWHLPGSGWIRHLDNSARWSRAALAVRWRLTEAQALHLLGTDLEPLAAVLGSPGADDHCRMLADWHRRAARRRLTLTAFLAAALILLAGGGLVLGSFRMWAGFAM